MAGGDKFKPQPLFRPDFPRGAGERQIGLLRGEEGHLLILWMRYSQ
jgi:hypothetical protein